jgi:chromosomal replication initiator protein
MKAIWSTVKAAIKSHIPAHSYRMWIEPLKLAKFDQNCMVLSSPNFFSKKRVLDQYSSLIESETAKAAGKTCKILIEISDTKFLPGPKPDNNLQLSLPNINLRPHNGRFLRKDFTFDQFVVGGNNDFAYSASLSLASKKNFSKFFVFIVKDRPGQKPSFPGHRPLYSLRASLRPCILCIRRRF